MASKSSGVLITSPEPLEFNHMAQVSIDLAYIKKSPEISEAEAQTTAVAGAPAGRGVYLWPLKHISLWVSSSTWSWLVCFIRKLSCQGLHFLEFCVSF